MGEIAFPLNTTPRRLQRTALRVRLRKITAARRTREPATGPCCFGRMGAKDAMVARGLAAAATAVVGQRGPQQ